MSYQQNKEKLIIERARRAEEREKKRENENRRKSTSSPSIEAFDSPSLIESPKHLISFESEEEEEMETPVNKMEEERIRGEDKGGKSLPWSKMPEFSGDINDNMDVEDWLEQVESFAQTFKWSKKEKVARILLALKGTAAQWARRLNAEDKSDPTIFCEKLVKTFKASTEGDWARELRRAMQKESESVAIFANRIEYMGRKAGYHSSSPALLHSFIDGLHSTIKSWVILQHPKNLKEAVMAAQDREESIRHETYSDSFIQGLVLTLQQNKINQSDTVKELRENMEKLQLENENLKKEISKMKGAKDSESQNRIPVRPVAVKDQIRCYYCNKVGHKKAQCRLLKNQTRTREASTQGAQLPAK